MGELFETFDASWSYFLAREEPLEDFLAALPEDEDATAAVWLIPLAPQLAAGVAAVQSRLPRVPWLRPAPAHFLHVTLAERGFLDGRGDIPALVAEARDALRGAARFSIALPRLNCFHEAVVAEVESDGIAAVAARLGGTTEPFLPHVSLAYTTAPGPVEHLRPRLVELRQTDLGEQEVGDVALCLVPASRTTIFEPWTVAGRIALR